MTSGATHSTCCPRWYWMSCRFCRVRITSSTLMPVAALSSLTLITPWCTASTCSTCSESSTARSLSRDKLQVLQGQDHVVRLDAGCSAELLDANHTAMHCQHQHVAPASDRLKAQTSHLHAFRDTPQAARVLTEESACVLMHSQMCLHL